MNKKFDFLFGWIFGKGGGAYFWHSDLSAGFPNEEASQNPHHIRGNPGVWPLVQLIKELLLATKDISRFM